MIRLALAALLFLGGNDDDALWRALDTGDAAALQGRDTAELLKAIRGGRAVDGKTGEIREEITDAYGTTTDVIFVVPSSYERHKPAGAIIVLHGLGGDSKQLKDEFKLFAEEYGYIVISPSAQKEPESAPNEDMPKGDLAKSIQHWWSYRDGSSIFLALSTAKKRWAIDENRVFIGGYSMGGFGSWNIGLRYPDRFAAAMPFAGGISRNEYFRKNDDKMRPLVRNAYNLPFFFVHGDKDFTVPVTFARRTRDQLKEYGYSFEYREVPKGGHMLDVREGSDIANAMESWIKPKRRNAHPREIRHYFIGDYCPQAYWVRVSKFSGESASVDARITGQTIEFTSKGAGEITFYVDETLLDLSKPIKVTSGGKTLFEKKVEPSADVVVETWKAREDRELTFRAKIVVGIR